MVIYFVLAYTNPQQRFEEVVFCNKKPERSRIVRILRKPKQCNKTRNSLSKHVLCFGWIFVIDSQYIIQIENVFTDWIAISKSPIAFHALCHKMAKIKKVLFWDSYHIKHCSTTLSVFAQFTQAMQNWHNICSVTISTVIPNYWSRLRDFLFMSCEIPTFVPADHTLWRALYFAGLQVLSQITFVFGRKTIFHKLLLWQLKWYML